MARKKRTFDNKTYLLDRTGTHKKSLQKIGKYAKKTKAIRAYRIVKNKSKYEFYIKP